MFDVKSQYYYMYLNPAQKASFSYCISKNVNKRAVGNKPVKASHCPSALARASCQLFSSIHLFFYPSTLISLVPTPQLLFLYPSLLLFPT